MIQSVIGSLDSTFQLCEEMENIANRIYLKPKEKKVLETLHGMNSVREICNALEIPDFEICRTLLGFHAVGIVEKIPLHVETA
jgi:hypothetical protein